MLLKPLPVARYAWLPGGLTIAAGVALALALVAALTREGGRVIAEPVGRVRETTILRLRLKS